MKMTKAKGLFKCGYMLNASGRERVEYVAYSDFKILTLMETDITSDYSRQDLGVRYEASITFQILLLIS